MANTYTQLYIHLVFAVKHRNALIKKEWSADFEKYITGIVQNHKHKLLAIKTMPDHIHIFIGYNVNHLIPDLVENIKTSSNEWVKTNKVSNYKFEWQKGYGAFSHSRAQLDTVVNYILNQEEHHTKNHLEMSIWKSFAKMMLNLKTNMFLSFSMEMVIGSSCRFRCAAPCFPRE